MLKTRKRYEHFGHARALNFSCTRNLPLLRSERACCWIVDAVDHARAKHSFDLWAYVVMPTHVHLLVLPRSDTRVSDVLSTIKQRVARTAVRWLRTHDPEWLSRMTRVESGGRRVFRFWQRGGGYDRNLWSTRYVWEMIDYIHANPIEAGLCESPMSWRWSSARAFYTGEAVPLALDLESLPPDPR